MTLEKLYEIMQIKFLDSAIIEKMTSNDGDFGIVTRFLKIKAEALLAAINDGSFFDNAKVKEEFVNALHSMAYYSSRRIGITHEGIDKQEYDEFKETVEAAEKNVKVNLQALHDNIISEEPKSMTMDEFRNYLLEPSKIHKSEEFKKLENLFKNDDFLRYEKEYYNKTHQFTIAKTLVMSHAQILKGDALSIRKSLEENPKAIFDKKKLGFYNQILFSIRQGQMESLIKDLKERKSQVPEGPYKDTINAVCDKYLNWLEKFDKNVELTSAYVKDKISHPNTKTEGEFGGMIDELNRAKTTYNSSQYTEIIDMLEAINRPEPKRENFPLNAEQMYVVKLLTLRKLIYKYIDHKLDSGVKQNVYKKLAAVEKLNQNISERLKYLDTKIFSYGIKGNKIVSVPSDDPDVKTVTVDLSKVYHTYKSEVAESTALIELNNKNYKIPEPLEPSELKKQYEKVIRKHQDVNMEEMKNAHNCMSRIILSAMRHNKSLQEVKEYEEQQDRFWNHPVKRISKEAESAAQEAPNEAPQMNL